MVDIVEGSFTSSVVGDGASVISNVGSSSDVVSDGNVVVDNVRVVDTVPCELGPHGTYLQHNNLIS